MAQRADALRDLVFVLLGLKTGLVDQPSLLDAFQEWDCGAGRPLVEVLLGRGALADPQLSALERLVTDHLRAGGVGLDGSLPTVGVGPRQGGTNSGVSGADGPGQTVASGPPDSGLTWAETDPCQTAPGDARARPDGGDDGFTLGQDHQERFKILSEHARGGLGVVSVALDRELNREVALKQIQPRYADDTISRSRFVLEAEITGGLEHPGVVPVYALGVDPEGRPYYAMRFIRGDSLKDAIDAYHGDAALAADPSRRSLELRKLLRRLLDVCNTVDYAHGRSVLHRDIKPANIMVGRYGETLVVDWGIAKLLGEGSGDESAAPGERPLHPKSAGGSTETLPGSAIGTPAFMSPEQAVGDLSRVGPASDVYSLGATLYYLLTGKPAFPDGDLRAVLRAVETGDFPPPRKHDRTIPAALEAVCLKAMAHDVKGRYPTARALAEDVERWMADEPVSAYREPALDRARRWMRHNRTAVAAAAVAVVAGLAGLGAITAVQAQANGQLRQLNHSLEQTTARLADANRDLVASNQREKARFLLAMNAIRLFHTGVSEDFLLQQDGFKDLRDKLLNAAREFYVGLEKDLEGQRDFDSQVALGRSYYELGDLASRVATLPDALRTHAQALSLRQELTRSPGAGLDQQADVGASLLAVGLLEQQTGKRDDAERDLRGSQELLERLAGESPGEPRYAAGLGRVERRLGELLLEQNQTDLALRQFNRARATWDGLCKNRPDDPEYQSEQASVDAAFGRVYASQGLVDDAIAALDRARSRRQRLVDAHPDQARYRNELAGVLNLQGITLLRVGRTEEALKAFRATVEVRERLVRDFRAAIDLQVGLARSYHRFAVILRQTGRVADALEYYARAQDAREGLAKGNPSVPLYRLDLAAVLYDSAGLLYETGQVEKAAAQFARSQQLTEELVRDDPANAGGRRAVGLRQILAGMLHADSGRVVDALGAYADARSRFAGLAAENPKEVEYRYLLSYVDAAEGRLLSDEGRPDDARAPFAAAAAALNELRRLEPVTPHYRADLAAGHVNTATLLADRGRTAAALAELAEARGLYSVLAKANPSFLDYRAGLAAVDEATGQAYALAGKVDEALPAFERAREAYEALADEVPELFEYRHALAQNRVRVAEALGRAGRAAAGVDECRKAVTIASALAESYPKVRGVQVTLATALARLGTLLGASGDPREAVDTLQLALTILERPEFTPLGPSELYRLAAVEAALARLDPLPGGRLKANRAALGALRRAVEVGYRDRIGTAADPDFADLRGLPEFQTVLVDMAVPFDPLGPVPPALPVADRP